MNTLHGQRGQTLPFWGIGVVVMLALAFFIANYTNIIRWQIKAQTAADAAASAGIATDANMYNEVNTLLYAAAVDETRMRYLAQAIVNTINDPSGCGSNCDAYYQTLVSAYATAASNYKTLTQSLQRGDNLTQGGLKNGPAKAIKLVSSNCSLFDCSFSYTSTIDQANEIVDVVACKNVATLFPAVLGVSAGNNFTAVGRSASTMVAISETFSPSATNPNTGKAYQPDELPATGAPIEYGASFSTLSLNMSWYVAGPTKPAKFGSYTCS